MNASLVPSPFQFNAQLSKETCTCSTTDYAQLDNDELIEACFRTYYQSMFGAYDLESIYARFRTVAYQRLALRGIGNDDAEYLLRSGRFVHFVKNLINNPVNESLTTSPSASESGNDEEETSATEGEIAFADILL